MCELVSGADTVDSDEVCAVVFREIGVCESATSAEVRTEGGSAKRGKGKGESVRSVKKGRGWEVSHNDENPVFRLASSCDGVGGGACRR